MLVQRLVRILPATAVAVALTVLSIAPASAQVSGALSIGGAGFGVSVFVGQPPPPLPYYAPPPVPNPNYIWMPGYWRLRQVICGRPDTGATAAPRTAGIPAIGRRASASTAA
jgi:hypothetical protein